MKQTKKDKKFIVRICPKCKSDDVMIPIGAKKNQWQCRRCNYSGIDFIEKELSEEEFLEYNEKKGDINFDLGEPETVEAIGEKKSYKDILRERVARGEKI